MPDDRDFAPHEVVKPSRSATIVLLALNALVFVVQHVLLQRHRAVAFEEYFALSLDGLRQGHLWQLLTFQFMHGSSQSMSMSLVHIIANAWAIWVFGPVVETVLGKRRMVGIFLLSGVAGGLLQMLCSLVLPGHFGVEGVVGASAGAFGLVAAFAVLYPSQRLVMLLLFVIPIAMKARTLLWVSVAFAVFGMIYPFGNIGHAAHLGGTLTGYIITRLLMRGYQVQPAVDIVPKSALKVTQVTTAPD